MTHYKEQLSKLQHEVSKGEGQYLEFKRKVAFPEKIAREMIAFANTRGGVLLLGVNDDGNITGLKHPEEESFTVDTYLDKHCWPKLEFQEIYLPIGNTRTIVKYEIPVSKSRPHYLSYIQSGLQRKESFVRVGDQSIKASYEMREIIRRGTRMQDVKFHYGDHEGFLMKYLDENPFITLQEFIRIRKISKFQASRKLVRLVLANVLRIIPTEGHDRYTLAPQKDSKNLPSNPLTFQII